MLSLIGSCLKVLREDGVSCGASHVSCGASHVVNRLPVSLTSYVDFAVNESFGVIVVQEKQVLLTTHVKLSLGNVRFIFVDKISPLSIKGI